VNHLVLFFSSLGNQNVLKTLMCSVIAQKELEKMKKRQP